MQKSPSFNPSCRGAPLARSEAGNGERLASRPYTFRMPFTDRELAAMNQQELTVTISEMTPGQLRAAIKAPINSQQQAVILDQLARHEAKQEARTSRFVARIAIGIALVPLLVSVATWLGWQPV